MKQMIVLCGSSNTGKTTTLIDLAKDLCQNGGNIVFPQLTSSTIPNSAYYEIDYKGKRILIATGGDTQHVMSANFARVKPATDVFVVASRSKHGSKILGMIEAFAQQHGIVPDYVAAVYNSLALHPLIRRTRVNQIEKLIF